jgi:hypothetical protein
MANKQSPKANWVNIIRAITTPLGYFVLGTLIFEPSLALILTCARLTEWQIWFGLVAMILIFIGLIVTVAIFTWSKPKNLLFGKEEHASETLSLSALRDQIEDIVALRVNPDCLKSREE